MADRPLISVTTALAIVAIAGVAASIAQTRRSYLLWLLRHHLHHEYTIIDRRKPPIKKPPRTSDP